MSPPGANEDTQHRTGLSGKEAEPQARWHHLWGYVGRIVHGCCKRAFLRALDRYRGARGALRVEDNGLSVA